MRTPSQHLALGVAAALTIVACAKVPYTNRSQFRLIPDGQMNATGAQAYDQMLAQVQVKRKGTDAKTLQRVGERVAAVADEPKFAWAYALIADPQLNAWCLPGGKIGFYEGILPVLQSEAGMSFVMGHEVGHAVARHGAERMSQQLATVGGLSLLDLFLSGSGKLTDEQRGLMMGALGLTAEVGVMLPFSRKHELEADTIGMMFMASAGYPPVESLGVWERMSAAAGGGPPVFLSTHPSPEGRIENQREWMPEAKKRYRRNKLDEPVRQAIWGSAK